jgi:hypothetical protein
MQRLRAYSVELVLVGILLAAVFFFGYLGYGLLRPEIIDEPFSGEKARANVARQLEFGVRSTGAEGNQRTGDWLIEQLRVLGWDVVIQPITIGDTLTGRNIVGIRSPGQAGAPVALLATHYDTRLAADADPDPAQQMQPTPGANANAAGVAVLVELARTLDVDATGHTICLAFFDAEANSGLPGWSPHMGSQIFVDSQPESVPRCAAPQFVVDLDQVGAEGQVFYQSATDDRTLQGALWQTAAELGWSDTFQAEIKPPSVDYPTPFDGARVDMIHIFGADYPYAATTLDTLEQVSAATLERVGRTLEVWLEGGEQ